MSKEAMSFKRGDAVQVKGEEPPRPLYVVSVTPGLVNCFWWTSEGLHQVTLPEEQLELRAPRNSD